MNYKEQKIQLMLLNGVKIQLTKTNLFSFLNSCQTIGIEPDNFEKMMHIVKDHIIDGTNDHSSPFELKQSILFVRTLKIFLNNLKG